MDNELVLRIPHDLGAAEAQRRIAGGIATARTQYGPYLNAVETDWQANRLRFQLSAMAQTIGGHVDVEDAYIELRAKLPLVLRLLARRFVPVIETTGQKLLK